MPAVLQLTAEWLTSMGPYMQLTLQGRVWATEGLIGSLEDASDACIKGWVSIVNASGTVTCSKGQHDEDAASGALL
jgi:hypothetical protein